MNCRWLNLVCYKPPSNSTKRIRCFPLLSLLVTLALVGAGCSKEGKLNKHLARGDALYEEGEYDKARLEYLSALQLDPRNVHAVEQVANILFESGSVLQAYGAYQQAVKMGAGEPRTLARMAVLMAGSRQTDAAREQALKAIEADPAAEEALFLLADISGNEQTAANFRELLAGLRTREGNLPIYDAAEAAVLLKQGDSAGALSLAQRSIDGAPESAAGHFVLAGVLLTQTNLTAGEKALAKAAELSKPRSNRRIQYINFLLRQGSTNEAQAQLEAVIDAAPDYIPARLRMGQLALAGGEFDAVDREINAVLTRDRLNVEARLMQTQLHLSRREPEKAAEVMSQLVSQFPESPQLQYQAALTDLANQNPNQARMRLDRAFELNPLVPETVLLRARLYLARGQTREVINSVQSLIATNATIRPAYLVLGEALMANGEPDRALAVLRDYERRFTEDPAGPQATGMVQLRRNDYPAARAAFERALVLRTDFLPAIERLVGLDILEAKTNNAVARASAFVEAKPDLAEGRVLAAQAHLAAADAKSAETELERAIELNPRLQPAYLLLARVYDDSDRREEALASLRALLERKPDDERALMMLGILLTKTGDYKAAAESYETILKASDSFSPALNNLAYLYSEKLERLPRAYELARRSRQLLPDDPSIADTLGWILHHRGEYQQALVYLEESAARLPRVAEVQYHLGMAHYAMAHETPARSAFELALNLDPNAAWIGEINDRLAVLDADASKADGETLKRLEQMAEKRPNDVLLLTRLGEAYEGARKWDEALKHYRLAASTSPDAVPPQIGQARVLVANGDAAGALTIARRARDLAKSDVAALYELGRIAYLARDYSWSYALLQEALTGAGNDPASHFTFAQAALAVGRLEVARTALVKAAGIERAALQLALIPHCASGLPAPVPADVRRQLEAAPAGELLADYLKARSLALDGPGAGAAVRALDEVLTSYPQFLPAKRSLAILLARNDDGRNRAEALAREVRGTQPNDAEMAKVLGEVAFARADYRYAADMLQEASRTLNRDGELLLLLGRARQQNQQMADARQAINQALALPLSDDQKQEAQGILQQLK